MAIHEKIFQTGLNLSQPCYSIAFNPQLERVSKQDIQLKKAV